MTVQPRQTLRRILVDVQVGKDLMAASDDPVFLGLRGPCGREFRLAFRKGKPWRRGERERFILGGEPDPETNVDRPELNDPAQPAVDLDQLAGVYVRKGLDPIPNVRGHGEMDDRLQLESVEVELYADGLSEPLRFARRGPFWLGLVCGMSIEIPPADAGR